ncbi:MAG: hypothetical protein NWQ07_02585 [Flaviramulus sp.]|nr:hypothetical protein [Flaviramulus sp.]
MKKVFFIVSFLIASVSCKNETKSKQKEETISSESAEKQNNGLTHLKGEFIYYADAAVLQTNNEIYGVVIDEKMHELDEQVKPFKTEPTDMIIVEIKGKIIPKPENEEGWPLRVEIKEILSVSKPLLKDQNIIKLGQ